MSDILIPERLILVREKLGISKAEAARRVGLSKMGYGRYESGERAPSAQIIEVMAQRLETSSDYLTGKDNDPKKDYIVIRKADDPELFSLLEHYSKGNDKQKELLRHYFKELNKKD